MSNQRTHTAVVAQFAKAPELGSVKTRMVPILTQAECAQLHKRLVTHVYKNVAGSSRYFHQLWVSKPHAFFDGLISDFQGVCHSTLKIQPAGDLGERLARALKGITSVGNVAIVIGSDCVDLDAAYIERAIALLDTGHALDAVVGPAYDGGFVLLALKRWDDKLFSDIEWGTATVLDKLTENMASLGFECAMLETLHDVDRPEDLSLTKNI